METLKKIVIQHKWLCISSFIGVFLAFGVASDDADLNFFQAFVSVEVVILIVYFVVLNSKKKKAQRLQSAKEAQELQERQRKEREAYWASLTPEQQMVELKRQEMAEAAAMHQESMKVQQAQLEMQTAQYNAMMKCPKCGSTSISGQKKGYGVVKGAAAAAAGFATAGVGTAILGLGAGNMGRNKVYCTCMSCGYRWKAGKK